MDICTNHTKNTNNISYLQLKLQETINNKFGIGSATLDKYYAASPDYVLSSWLNRSYRIPAIELEINGAYRWFEGDCERQSLDLFKCIEKWLKNIAE